MTQNVILPNVALLHVNLYKTFSREILMLKIWYLLTKISKKAKSINNRYSSTSFSPFFMVSFLIQLRSNRLNKKPHITSFNTINLLSSVAGFPSGLNAMLNLRINNTTNFYLHEYSKLAAHWSDVLKRSNVVVSSGVASTVHSVSKEGMFVHSCILS